MSDERTDDPQAEPGRTEHRELDREDRGTADAGSAPAAQPRDGDSDTTA